MFKKTKKDENKTSDIPSSSTTGTSSNPLTIKVTNSQYIKSRNDLVDDFNHKLKPTYYAIQDLVTGENVRVARSNSQIDSYFAVETTFREKMRKFHKQWCTTSKQEHAKNFVDNFCKIFNQIYTNFWISGCHKRQRSIPQKSSVVWRCISFKLHNNN